MKVIGGSSHPELTELIARKVGVRSCKILLEKFANNETNVQLMDQVRCQDVYIIQTGAVNSNDAVMELLLIINSCRLASADSITVITPYFPYSKGDQKSSLRSPITAKLLANMIQKAGAHHLMMLDAHSPQLEGFFDHPVDCLKVEPLFCSWITHHVPNWQDCIVVSPDEGGAKRSVMIANDLGLEFAMIHNRHKKSLKQMTPVDSRRSSKDDLSGDILSEDVDAADEIPEELKLTHNQVDKYLKISGDVAGMDCIVVDDMIDTGSTIRLALEVLHSHNAGKVYVFATHGIFSGCARQILREEKFPNLEKIVVTNSLPQTKNKEFFGDKIEVVDISGMVSEYIRRSHYNESVSVLSNNYQPGIKEKFRLHQGQISYNECEDFQEQVEPEIGEVEDRNLRRVRKGFRLESICWD